MQSERAEYATADLKGRRLSTKRLVKLPGEKRHVERSDAAAYIARKLEIDKREKRIRNG